MGCDAVVKMRSGLHERIEVYEIADAVGLSGDEVIARLYKAASWFATHGKYGKIAANPSVVDTFCRTPGFADALIEQDWMRHEHGVCWLRFFCYVSTARKGIGKRARKEILASGKCVNCGASENLHIDHIIPVSRGGGGERSNLQALCASCNMRKGCMTMEEFLAMEQKLDG